MAAFDSTTETLRRLVDLVAENGLAELTLEEEGLVITVKAEPSESAAVIPSGLTSLSVHPHVLPLSATPPYSQTAVTAPKSTPAATPNAPVGRPPHAVALESPMIGVFYLFPAPGDPPFVKKGDTITVGQTIGLIEAMKVYSEVPSEIAGRVVEIVAENGKLVQQGQALIYVEPV